MFISKDGKLFGKISVIDVIVVLVIAALVVFCVKKFSANDAVSASNYTTVVMEFTQPDAPNYVYDNIKEGDRCMEGIKSTYMGNVTATEKSESLIYVESADGQLVAASQPDECTIKITMEATGYIQDGGGVYVDGTTYYVGKSYEFRAGVTALYGKVTAAYAKES